VTGIPIGRRSSPEIAENRATSITAEVLASPVSEARITSAAAEVLATASSEARVSTIAVEALVSHRGGGAGVGR
jgi:hypothetical protein